MKGQHGRGSNGFETSFNSDAPERRSKLPGNRHNLQLTTHMSKGWHVWSGKRSNIEFFFYPSFQGFPVVQDKHLGAGKGVMHCGFPQVKRRLNQSRQYDLSGTGLKSLGNVQKRIRAKFVQSLRLRTGSVLLIQVSRLWRHSFRSPGRQSTSSGQRLWLMICPPGHMGSMRQMQWRKVSPCCQDGVQV